VRKTSSKKNSKQFRELIKLVKNIDDKLDTLVNFQRTLLPTPKLGKEERKVLKLCDRKNTIAEMATKTGKTSNNVNFILTKLRRRGVIRSVKVKNRTVYEKI
jgi:predicted transcriptional regulator